MASANLSINFLVMGPTSPFPTCCTCEVSHCAQEPEEQKTQYNYLVDADDWVDFASGARYEGFVHTLEERLGDCSDDNFYVTLLWEE